MGTDTVDKLIEDIIALLYLPVVAIFIVEKS